VEEGAEELGEEDEKLEPPKQPVIGIVNRIENALPDPFFLSLS